MGDLGVGMREELLWSKDQPLNISHGSRFPIDQAHQPLRCISFRLLGELEMAQLLTFLSLLQGWHEASELKPSLEGI